MGIARHIGKELPVSAAAPIDLRRRKIGPVQLKQADPVVIAALIVAVRRIGKQPRILRCCLPSHDEFPILRTHLDQRVAHLGNGRQPLGDERQPVLCPRKDLLRRSKRLRTEHRQIETRRLTVT